MFGRRLPLAVALLVCLPTAGLAQLGRSIDRWSVEQGLPNNAVADLLQTRDGYLWIGTWAGMVRFDGVRFTTLVGALPNDHATVLFEDRDGALWIGVAGTGLVRRFNTEVRTFTPADGLPGSNVRAIVQDRSGRIWAGTESGLSAIESNGIQTVSAGLPHRTVSRLAAARDGGVWVGTAAGLCRVPEGGARCEAAGTSAGERIDALLEDRDGRLWIGSVAGLRTAAGQPHPACTPGCLRGTGVTVLMQTRDGDLWAGLGTGGVARIHAGGIERISTADGLPAGTVVALYEDEEGSLWVGIYNGGLARLKPHRVRTYSTADGLPADVIGSIVQDAAGTIWAGAQCGPVSRLDGDRFTPQFAERMRGACAWVLWPARDGSLWIGTRGQGLYRVAGGRLDHYGTAEGLSDPSISGLLEAEDANLWVGTARGISRLARDRIEAVAEGRAASLDPILLDRADGMRNPEGSGGGLDPSGLRDRDGQLWLSTIDGIAVIDPRRFRTNQIAPRVLVEDVHLDERPWPRRDDGVVEIPAGTSSIELAYTAFSFVAPAKMRFRYRLDGFDTGWHEVGPRRAAYYSRLPPGEYTLEVMATNNDGVWSTAPARQTIVVLPFFWERPPVQLAALGLLLLGTGLAANRAAHRRARRRVEDLERERALERERTRIARDLHDDLGSRLAQIALMADRISSDGQLSASVRTAVESLDELVWTVNARHDSVEGFAAYAARFAEEHVGAAGLRLRLQIDPDLPAVEVLSDTRRHLYLAYKEAVHNAVKHGGGSDIHVAIRLEAGMLVVEVRDHGPGFHGAGDPTGNGLVNLRERMASIGGRVEFGDAPGGGARVVLRAPA